MRGDNGEVYLVLILIFIAIGFGIAKCTEDDHSKYYGSGVRSLCIHGLEYLQSDVNSKPQLLKDEYNHPNYCNY